MPGMEKLDSFLGLWISSIYSSGNIMEERAEKLYEPEFQKVYRETDSPRNGCVNKTGTMAMNTSTWKGGNVVRSHLLTKSYRQLMTAGEGELASARFVSLLTGCLMQSGHPWGHIYKGIFIYFAYTHI